MRVYPALSEEIHMRVNLGRLEEMHATVVSQAREEFHGRARSAQREDIHACELSTARGSARVQTVAEMSVGTRANRRKAKVPCMSEESHNLSTSLSLYLQYGHYH
ncbi:hypothetical protein Bbelb_061500 [Branchiostoma belcheri]|nr:hypothetical protein Bbelb_061500 [Branchiostoma belcheri]